MAQHGSSQATADLLRSTILSKFFSVELPFSRFCWNILVFSFLSILPILIVYVALTPGFVTMLTTNRIALIQFMRQVLTNGVPVVFFVNYIGFVAVSAFLRRERCEYIRHFLLDGFSRALLFIVLHALIYVLSADFFASFGGDRRTALQVIGPTLERAFLFENLSGVYLYSILPGAIIAYIAGFRQRQNAGVVASGSLELMPNIVIALGPCIYIVLIVTVLSMGLTSLIGRP